MLYEVQVSTQLIFVIFVILEKNSFSKMNFQFVFPVMKSQEYQMLFPIKFSEHPSTLSHFLFPLEGVLHTLN